MKGGSHRISRFLVLLTIIVLTACQGPGDKTAPEALIGVWETSERDFEGCSLEITATQLIYRNPETEPGVNHIKRIERMEDKAGTLYKIHYEDAEGLGFSLSLYLVAGKGGEVIQFMHRPETEWRRRGQG